MLSHCDAWLLVYSKHCVAYIDMHEVVVENFTFAISSPDELLV